MFFGIIRFIFWNVSFKKRILGLKGVNFKILWIVEWYMFKKSYDWWMFLYYKRIVVYFLWLKIVISFSLVFGDFVIVGVGWSVSRWGERFIGALVVYMLWLVIWYLGKVIKFVFVFLFFFEVNIGICWEYWGCLLS